MVAAIFGLTLLVFDTLVFNTLLFDTLVFNTIERAVQLD